VVGAAPGGAWIARVQMVRQVARLGPELTRLVLPKPELPRQAHVDADASRTLNIAPAHIPIFASRGPHEGRGVEIQFDTLVGRLRTGKNLVRACVAVRRQAIDAGRYGQPTAGQYPD